MREKTISNDDRKRKIQKDRHDSGVNSSSSFNSGSLVMLHDGAQAKKKLRASFKGPFVIVGYRGDHKRSYTLRQINGKPIYKTFNGNQLTLYKPREGRLIPNHEESHRAYQSNRRKITYSKLPKTH